MKPSLGTILVIGLTGLQLVAVLMVVFTSYLSSERALIGHARDLLNDVGTNTIEHSKGFLQPAHGAAELAANLAQNDVVASDNPQLLEQLFFQQLQLSPQFSGIFHGNAEGEFVYVMRSDGAASYRSKFIQVEEGTRRTHYVWRDDDYGIVTRRPDPEDTFDPRTRPWYIRASAERDTIWTDPYIFFSSQKPGITLASPVIDGTGRVTGVMGVDIEISDISEFLSRLRVGATGKALIIHRNGDVIAHPDQEVISTLGADGTLRFAKIWELEDPIARTAFSSLYQPGSETMPGELSSQFTYQGNVFVSLVKPVIGDNLPWTIAVYAPEDDFTAGIKANRYFNIWIAVTVAAITALIGLAMANYIYRPVRAFAVRSALISQGELDPSEPPPRTFKELERANAALMQEIVARRQTEFEYGQTIELASRAIAHIAPETGAFIRVNPKFCELTGYDAEELRHLRLGDVAIDMTDEGRALMAAGQDGELPVHQEMRWRRKDGADIWVRLDAFVVRNEGDEALYSVAMVDDVTGTKSQEKQIRQLSRDLSQLARGHMMGQMASGLAHELNQPLAAIAQNADAALIAAERGAARGDDLRPILEEIEAQALRAGDIIRAMRSFIRKDTSNRVVFDLAELIDQSRRLVLPEATEAGVRIGIETEGETLVEANRTQVAQVLVNLLRNGVEAIAASDTADRRVTVRTRRDGARVRVEVSDTGPGVAADVTLFSEFETTKPKGMGLGLSICRSIVEANDGKLWHDADHRGGARFVFTLPGDPGTNRKPGTEAA
ncbi:MAG: PAS domain S-box protein [Rhodobacteraceae bacterium]|nr:MAG: PAS domain S-box protein [Paracoccaceae bacterium]